MTPDEQQQKRDAYLATLTEDQRRRFHSLETWKPSIERTDLVCADCGAQLTLRLGRYGRFYGCVNYDTTGCKGGVSAFNSGVPKGWPGNAATRAARKKLVELFENAGPGVSPPDDGDRECVRDKVASFLGKEFPFSIAELSQEECERAIQAWDAIVPPVGRTGHLLRVLFDPQTDYDPEWP